MSQEENDNSYWQAQVKALSQQPSNQTCSDCVAVDSTWASINLGVFICINCSGVHRSLGTHLTKVRSVDLDTWDKKAAEKLIEYGNQKANMYWECNVFPYEKPQENDPYIMRHHYITNKYVHKKYTSSDGSNTPTRTFDVGALYKKEYVTKQGLKRKNWKKRWLYLHENVLAYYKNQKASFPAGTITLDSKTKIEFVDESVHKKKNCFCVNTENRQFYLYTDTPEKLIEWVVLLRAAVHFCQIKESSPHTLVGTSNVSPATVFGTKASGDDEDSDDESPGAVPASPRTETRLRSFSARILPTIGGAKKTIVPVEKKGYLRKQGGSYTVLRKRWIVLENNRLFYYKTDKDTEPNGEIPIKGSKIIPEQDSADKKKGYYPFSILTHGRKFYLVADTEKDCREWVEAINQAVTNLSDPLLAASAGMNNARLSAVHGEFEPMGGAVGFSSGSGSGSGSNSNTSSPRSFLSKISSAVNNAASNRNSLSTIYTDKYDDEDEDDDDSSAGGGGGNGGGSGDRRSNNLKRLSSLSTGSNSSPRTSSSSSSSSNNSPMTPTPIAAALLAANNNSNSNSSSSSGNDNGNGNGNGTNKSNSLKLNLSVVLDEPAPTTTTTTAAPPAPASSATATAATTVKRVSSIVLDDAKQTTNDLEAIIAHAIKNHGKFSDYIPDEDIQDLIRLEQMYPRRDSDASFGDGASATGFLEDADFSQDLAKVLALRQLRLSDGGDGASTPHGSPSTPRGSPTSLKGKGKKKHTAFVRIHESLDAQFKNLGVTIPE